MNDSSFNNRNDHNVNQLTPDIIDEVLKRIDHLGEIAGLDQTDNHNASNPRPRITDIRSEDLLKLPPEERERYWYQNYYQGDHLPQLTLRAIFMGAILGGIMSLSNLYVGLKTGWALGVAITSCILSYAINKGLNALMPKVFRGEMSILENNCMQSTASSAGYSTGGTMVSAICAYLILTGTHISWPILTLWTFFLSSLGVFLAIPMKRQMINVEQLKFPSGIAAAETLKSLHSSGAEAVNKARSLGIAGLIGGVITWFRDGGKPFALPGFINFPGAINNVPLFNWTISFEMSAIMIAAGAIMGWKVAWSMLLGGTVNYAFLAPKMVELGAIEAGKISYRTIVGWSTWAGASILVSSGLLMFFMQWKTIIRSLLQLKKLFVKTAEHDADRAADNLPNIPEIKISSPEEKFEEERRKQIDLAIEKTEVPTSWFLLGILFSGLGCIILLTWAFATAWWMGVIAIVATFFLSLVAARATGESDITPIGAMGKITQLMFGILAPSKIVTNLMTAGITSGAAASCADLLVDLKSGYLLGANPRKQFFAQYLGIFAGVLVIVPAFYLLVPDASVLGGDKWPAPSAQVWAAVATILANGLHSLHPTAVMGIIFGSLVGIILPLLELILPSRYRKFVPSAIGLGLSMVIPWWNSFSMFIGALAALIIRKRLPELAEKYIIPISSGLIAGESIMGIVVALLSATDLI